MKKVAQKIRKIWAGQSLARILMNQAFGDYVISGKVVDVGGGRSPDYFDYFKKAEKSGNLGVVSIELVDASISGIDFEKDPLPQKDNVADTVICANVLEHVYNYRFLACEIARILKPGGQLIGFVPFLINYHPDPHDFFRYTPESLMRILNEAGLQNVNIRPVGGGQFSVNYNNVVLSAPRFLRVILLPLYLGLDAVALKLRPGIAKRFPLGYIFTGIKN